MAAPTTAARVKKLLANPEPSTHGPEVTAYALRHSSIVRQLLAGVPVRVVAHAHDTSVLMLERTYSRYISDHSDVLTRRALLDLAEPTADENVIPLPAAR